MTETSRSRRAGPTVPLSSADLIRECGFRMTDPALWKEFQARFQKTILTFVLRVMWNSFRDTNLDEARDLVQDIYLRLLDNNARTLRSFKSDTDFSVKAFLARTAMNVVTDRYRSLDAEKRRLSNVISIEQARESKRSLRGEAAEFDVESILSLIDVERLIEVDPDRRNAKRNVLIFKLYHLHGLTAAEIARYPGFNLQEDAVLIVLKNMRTYLEKRMGR